MTRNPDIIAAHQQLAEQTRRTRELVARLDSYTPRARRRRGRHSR